MATVILARHGRTEANAQRILAGRSAGVDLDETGLAQARAAAGRLAGLELAAAFSSPLERCRQTATELLAGRGLRARVERRLIECDYGEWTGRPMADLVREDLWRTVLSHPAGVRFPGGESMAEMSARSVAAVRDRDREVAGSAGDDAVWLAVAHGDIIKAVLADALGMHLDAFQRIVVDPGSLSVVRYTERRCFVLAVNSTAGSLAHLGAAGEHPAVKLGGGTGPARERPATP